MAGIHFAEESFSVKLTGIPSKGVKKKLSVCYGIFCLLLRAYWWYWWQLLAVKSWCYCFHFFSPLEISKPLSVVYGWMLRVCLSFLEVD